MNKQYYDTVVKLEKDGINPEYIQGWQGGYVMNPMREEQRVNEAYEAGFTDGRAKNTNNAAKFKK